MMEWFVLWLLSRILLVLKLGIFKKDLIDDYDACAKETEHNALYKHINKGFNSTLSNYQFSSPRFRTIDVENQDSKYDSSKQQKSINHTKTKDRLGRSKEKNFEGKNTTSNPNYHTISIVLSNVAEIVVNRKDTF